VLMVMLSRTAYIIALHEENIHRGPPTWSRLDVSPLMRLCYRVLVDTTYEVIVMETRIGFVIEHFIHGRALGYWVASHLVTLHSIPPIVSFAFRRIL